MDLIYFKIVKYWCGFCFFIINSTVFEMGRADYTITSDYKNFM